MKADAKTEAEVRAVLTKLTNSYEKRDLEGFMGCFAPDPHAVLYGTGIDEKRIGLAEIRMQAQRDWDQSEAISMAFDWISVSAAGGVAWAAMDGAFKVRAGGQEFTMPARVTLVLVKRDDRWLIVQSHFSAPAAGQQEGESFPG